MLRRTRIPAITDRQWGRLKSFFAHADRTLVMPHEIANEAGVSPDLAVAIMQAFAIDGDLRFQLLIYHCDEAGGNVAARDFDAGLPSFPYVCPECGRRVRNERGLRFGLIGRATRPLELE